MKKSRKIARRKLRRRLRIVILFVFSLIVILAVFFALRHFSVVKGNSYIIKNKYYSFELKTPQGWFAEGNDFYSEEKINRLLSGCQNNSESNIVGEFRFKSKKYPQALASLSDIPTDAQTQAILDLKIICQPNCSKNSVSYKINKYVYVSPNENNIDEQKLRSEYEAVFKKIMSSLKFTND